jgi:hypothetical protein
MGACVHVFGGGGGIAFVRFLIQVTHEFQIHKDHEILKQIGYLGLASRYGGEALCPIRWESDATIFQIVVYF